MKKPKLTFPEEIVTFLKKTYSSANTILEYGSGGSTVLASEMPNKTIYSVESDANFLCALNTYLQCSNKTISMPITMHVDIGQTQKFGHPM